MLTGAERKASRVLARRNELIQRLLTLALKAYEATEDCDAVIELVTRYTYDSEPITRDKRILYEAANRLGNLLTQEGYAAPGCEMHVAVRGTYWPMTPVFAISMRPAVGVHAGGKPDSDRPGAR